MAIKISAFDSKGFHSLASYDFIYLTRGVYVHEYTYDLQYKQYICIQTIYKVCYQMKHLK